MKFRPLNVGVAIGAAMLLSAVQAQDASDLSYLAGAKAAGGEAQLEDLGYIHIKTRKGDDRAWSFWWQPRHHQCLSVAVVDGRFDAVTDTPAADCDQPAHGRDRNERREDSASPAPEVNLNDLLTRQAGWADVQIQKRGFRTVSAYRAGDTDYTIRSNEATGQCVQVAVKNGRVRYIARVRESACRR